MSYREIFSILSILIFFAGTTFWVLYFFCINPVYRWMQTSSSVLGQVIFVLCLFYYTISMAGFLFVVLIDVEPNTDGMEMHVLLTTFAIAIPSIALIGYCIRLVFKGLEYLGTIHNKIKNKRMS